MVFAATWSLKALHPLLAHHDHAEHPVCEISDAQQGTHLHDERYAGDDDCSICAFVLATPAVQPAVLPLPHAVLPFVAATVAYHVPWLSKGSADLTRRRGPPCLC